MSDGIPYADIIILALIAGFILLRLRNILGDKIGNDNPRYFHTPVSSANDKREPIVHVDEKNLKAKQHEEVDTYLTSLSNGSVASVIADVKIRDPHFTATHFLQGAKIAFEMVFDAFSKGDVQALKMLLSDAIFKEFNSEVASRESSETKTELTLISVQAKDITEAKQQGNVTQLTVRFLSEQVTLVRDKSGAIVEGDPSDVRQVEDYWTFERDITSKNPNWKVIET